MARNVKTEQTPPPFKMRQLCGHDIKIAESQPGAWAKNGLARSDTSAGEILLKPGLPVTIQNGLILHEMFHLVADLNGLHELAGNESAISVLANSFYAWMRDNKALVVDMAFRG